MTLFNTYMFVIFSLPEHEVPMVTYCDQVSHPQLLFLSLEVTVLAKSVWHSVTLS